MGGGVLFWFGFCVGKVVIESVGRGHGLSGCVKRIDIGDDAFAFALDGDGGDPGDLHGKTGFARCFVIDLEGALLGDLGGKRRDWNRDGLIDFIRIERGAGGFDKLIVIQSGKALIEGVAD